MKTMFVFGAGMVTGALAYSKLTEPQRREIAEGIDSLVRRGRTGELTAAMTDGIGSIADAVTGRVSGATDQVATIVADKIEGEPEVTPIVGVRAQ